MGRKLTIPALIPCENCGTQYRPDTSNYKKSKHHYCSRTCHDTAIRERRPIIPWCPTPAIAAYCAGFLDGDGNISINRAHSSRAEVRISNSDKPTLIWMHGQFNGLALIGQKPLKAAHHKPVYELIFSTGYAASFLQAVTPYLIIKKAEAEEAIWYETTPMTPSERKAYVPQARKGA